VGSLGDIATHKKGEHTMITLTDCIRVVDDEVSNWLEYPTEEQIRAVAHELLDRCFELEMSRDLRDIKKVWRDFDVEAAFREFDDQYWSNLFAPKQ
jgi:hypothetical protein